MNFIDIQSWWEVPCIAHFCSLFSSTFKLPEFYIEVSQAHCNPRQWRLVYSSLSNALLTGARRGSTHRYRCWGRSSQCKSVYRAEAVRADRSTAEGLWYIGTDQLTDQPEQLSDVPEASVPWKMSGKATRNSPETHRGAQVFSRTRLTASLTLMLCRYITLKTLSTLIRISRSCRSVPRSSSWSICAISVSIPRTCVTPFPDTYPTAFAWNRLGNLQKVADRYAALNLHDWNLARFPCHSYDRNGSSYWYFYGTRLYREDRVPGKSKASKAATIWQVICFTEEDWRNLATKLDNSTNQKERALHEVLVENFLPKLSKLFREQERKRRAR